MQQRWQYFKPQESAGLTNMLANSETSPDTKVQRCEKTVMLFNIVYTLTQLRNVLRLMREVGVFCRAIKGAQRANQKVSLTKKANARSKANCSRHDEICVCVHFLFDVQQHTTDAQLQDLVNQQRLL